MTARRSPARTSAARSRPQEATGPRLAVHPRRRVGRRSVLLGGAMVFFTLLAGSVAIQAQRIETQHRIDGVEQRLADAAEDNRELRAKVAAAESPTRILAAAWELGLVEPGPVVQLSPRVEDPDATDPGSRAPSAGDDGLDGDVAAEAARSRR